MFDQIFNMVNIGIVVLDRDLRVVEWNKWMEAHSGVSCDEISGTSIFDNYPDLNSRIFNRNVKSVLAFGNFYYFTQKLHRYLFPFKPIHSFGSKYKFMQQSCVMGPLYDTNNNIINIYIMVQDVSVVTNLITDLEASKSNAERANKYKSEFLASMSHELRTPLNSLLVLSKLLSDNKSKNLTEKQVEFAKIIHQSGNELLTLINDILDLSKVEAGKLEVNWEKIILSPWITHMEKTFKHMAEKKKLGFSVKVSDNIPEMIHSDSTRVAQIIKNLLSNAFKFTAKGEVTLTVEKPSNGLLPVNGNLTADSMIAFIISDTGIGLSEEKQKIIFEAFQQADSSTSRKYGGTGLGLSISKELAMLLGGELQLESEEGKGSTFTLLLPINHPEAEVNDKEVPDSDVASDAENVLMEPDRIVRLEVSRVRDDRRELTPGDKTVLLVDDNPGFLEILSELAHKNGFKTLVAGDGHTGLHLADYYQPSAIILDINMPEVNGIDVMERLKKNPKTRSIPVHFISGDVETADVHEKGAIGFLTKPVSVEDIEQCFAEFEALIKTSANSVLIAEDDISLNDKKVLIVDDDMRNVFALSSAIQDQVMSVIVGKNGKDGIEQLEANQDVDIVLMDIMMPEMDGYEAMREIRKKENFKDLPIIAITAKAMKGEKDRCIEAGASDYLSKPLDTEKLLSLMRVWLHQK